MNLCGCERGFQIIAGCICGGEDQCKAAVIKSFIVSDLQMTHLCQKTTVDTVSSRLFLYSGPSVESAAEEFHFWRAQKALLSLVYDGVACWRWKRRAAQAKVVQDCCEKSKEPSLLQTYFLQSVWSLRTLVWKERSEVIACPLIEDKWFAHRLKTHQSTALQELDAQQNEKETSELRTSSFQ